MFKVNNIVSQFNLDATVNSIEPYGNGLINSTFLITAINKHNSTKRFILQKINCNVFPNGDSLIENVEKVTAHLRSVCNDPRKVLSLVPTHNLSNHITDSDGSIWRVFNFVENSICLEHIENYDDFYECGFGFGNFHHMLKDFPVNTLVEVIPDFHNTPKRFEALKKAVSGDICGRAASVRNEIEFFMSEASFYQILYDNYAAKKLPLRVTHNDTKSNNILLDATTRKALCVIDLDTVMPGFSVNDFGDAIRFGASTAAEDEKDLSKVSLSLELFNAYTKGFITGCGDCLCKDEIALLPEGAKMMTLECGMRFLTDYLQGDTYFHTTYKEHNLVRARTQIELVKDMNRKWLQMKDIVKSSIE